MNPIVGGCLCGAVRYTSKSPPLMTAICSCKHCQRQSGTAFSVLVAVTNGRLDLGTWERIFYGEFDGQRRKRILVKVIGE